MQWLERVPATLLVILAVVSINLGSALAISLFPPIASSSSRATMPRARPFAPSASTVSTPAFAIANSLAVALLRAPGVQHFYENAFTDGRVNALLLGQPGYPMPQVLHGVWSTYGPDGKLGIAFVNWADTPSFWQGIFDPSCCGRSTATTAST